MASCEWAQANERNRNYHDNEWGIPVHEDGKQFEFLMLEVMQCGLSWDLMLKKREIFRQCFSGFDVDAVADYGEEDIQRILNTEGMIRSRRKVEAVIHDARCFQRIQAEFGSFCRYLWAFSDGKTICYTGHEQGRLPAQNGLSRAVSADLKRRGFKYLGAVTVYSHLQACGIINDHGADCPCFGQINAQYPTINLPCEDEA